MRNKKMSKAMNALKNSLFILHPKISAALLKIRQISVIMSELRLCKFKDDNTYLKLKDMNYILITLQIYVGAIYSRTEFRQSQLFGQVWEIIPTNSRNSITSL